MTNQELKSQVIADLIAAKYEKKDFSVSVRDVWYDTALTVKIKNPRIRSEEIEPIARRYESIDRCQRSGEILSGCNVYVNVQENTEAIDALAQQYKPEAEQIAEAARKYWEEVGGGWTGYSIKGNKRFYLFNLDGDYQISMQNAKSQERRRSRCLVELLADFLARLDLGHFGSDEATAQRLIIESIEHEKQRQKQEAERKQWEEENKRRQTEHAKMLELLPTVSTVEDLEESAQIVQAFRWPNLNKNNTMKEYTEQLTSPADYTTQKAKIVRKWTFNDSAAIMYFMNHLLTDFDQIAKIGGTYEENGEYINIATAIYQGSYLVCVVDTQGYNYARYVGFPLYS